MKIKKLIVTAILFGLAAMPVAAESVTERECSTDSYGNVTCRDKTYDKETGEITYSDEVIVETRGTGSSETVTSVIDPKTGKVVILSTGVPEVVNAVALAVVALGGMAFFLKKQLLSRE